MVKSLYVCLLILMPVWVQAETENAITIRGQVLDTDGNPLPGANIVIVDTPYNNIADKNGKYVLTVPDTERNREITLQVSFVGYTPQSLSSTMMATRWEVSRISSITLSSIIGSDLTRTQGFWWKRRW